MYKMEVAGDFRTMSRENADKRFWGEGKRRTKNLFQEVSRDKEHVLYSLKPHDGEYPSIRRLYLDMGDLSEYNFANKYFDSYDHWLQVANSTWMEDIVREMRIDLQARLDSIVLQGIIEDSMDPSSKTRVQSAKYILEEKWKDKFPLRDKKKGPVEKVGRPSTERIRDQAKQEYLHRDHSVDEDYSRLVKGNNPEYNKELSQLVSKVIN